MVCCAWAVSVACRPPSMATIALLVARQLVSFVVGHAVGVRESLSRSRDTPPPARGSPATRSGRCTSRVPRRFARPGGVRPGRMLRCERLEVLDRLIVRGQLEVIAHAKAEHGLGRRDASRGVLGEGAGVTAGSSRRAEHGCRYCHEPRKPRVRLLERMPSPR